jgi:hypothetical protein
MRRSTTGLVALVALLTGCSSDVVGTATPAAEVIAGPPEVGSCWLNDMPGGEVLPLAGAEPVACTDVHQAETIRVVDDVFDPQTPYPTTRTDLMGSAAASQWVLENCNEVTAASYLGNVALAFALFASTEARVPRREEWAAGARWIRCDVVYGFPTDLPAPGPMAGALDSPNSAAYHLCLTGTSDDYDFVSCDRPHEAEALGQPQMLPPTTPFPRDESTREALRAECAGNLPLASSDTPLPEGVTVDVFLGDERDWDTAGIVTCVLLPAGGGQTTTTLLH